MTTVIVTGAAGGLGRVLVPRLVQAGRRPRQTPAGGGVGGRVQTRKI